MNIEHKVRERKRSYFCIALVFCFIPSLYLLLPPIFDSEISGEQALVALRVIPFLENEKTPTSINILGRHLPRLSGRHGALEIYLLSPLMYLGNSGPFSLKIVPVLLTPIILLLTYCFTKALVGPLVACLSVLILSINPDFIELMKKGPVFGASQLVFALAAFLLLHRWHHEGRRANLVLGMFILGIGFNSRLYFTWRIAALALSWLIFYWRRYRNRSLRDCLFAITSLVFGMLPALSVYLSPSFWASPLGRLSTRTIEGVNNLDIVENFITRALHWFYLVGGQPKNNSFWTYYSAAFVGVSILFVTYRALFKERDCHAKRTYLWFLFYLATVFFFSLFTPTQFRPGHLIILFPEMYIVVSLAISQAYQLTKVRFIRIALTALVTLYLGCCVYILGTTYYASAIKSESLNGCHVQDLGELLKKQGATTAFVFGEAVAYRLRHYTGETGVVVRAAGRKNNAAKRFDKLIRWAKQDTYFVLTCERQTLFELTFPTAKKLFFKTVKEQGRRLSFRKAMRCSNGRTRFVLYSLKE